MQQSLFDPSKDSKKELWVDVRFPMQSSAKDFLGKFPIGINPTNQTTTIGKFPIGFNPTNFLYKSFESNMP